MNTLSDMNNIARPAGDWVGVAVKVVDQAQLVSVFEWIENKAKSGVDVSVRTEEKSPRSWRLGCYNFAGSQPAQSENIFLHAMNINIGDELNVLFESKDEAMLFKLTWG